MATTVYSQNSAPQSEIQNPIDSLVTLTIPISTKLTQTNFLTWKSQILPIIRDHKLTFPSPRPNKPAGPGFSFPGNQSSRPRHPKPPGPKPQCQICMKLGHTAKHCYNRYNADQSNVTSPQQQPSTFHAYLTQPTDSYDGACDWILD